jgi:hypothetical protein
MVFFASDRENTLSRRKLVGKDFYTSKVSENASFASEA